MPVSISVKILRINFNSIIRGEYFVYDLNDNTAPNIVARHWGRRSFHYDNCAIAMITLFAVQTSEGWIE